MSVGQAVNAMVKVLEKLIEPDSQFKWSLVIVDSKKIEMKIFLYSDGDRSVWRRVWIVRALETMAVAPEWAVLREVESAKRQLLEINGGV